MIVEQLRAARRVIPFRPFKIHLSDGRQFRVRHPDFFFVSPGGETVFVFNRKGAAAIMGSSLITSIELIP